MDRGKYLSYSILDISRSGGNSTALSECDIRCLLIFYSSLQYAYQILLINWLRAVGRSATPAFWLILRLRFLSVFRLVGPGCRLGLCSRSVSSRMPWSLVVIVL